MLKLQQEAAAVLRGVGGLLLGLILLLVIATGALALRLSHGPLDVTWLVRRVLNDAAPADHVASATIAIGRTAGGTALRVVVAGVQVAQGTTTATVQHAAVSLSLPDLLRGRVLPQSAAADGVRVNLVRQADGSFGAGSSGSGPNLHLDALTTLHITDAQLEVDDRAMGQTWQAAIPQASAMQNADGTLSGAAQLQARLGSLTEAAAVALARRDGIFTLHAALSPVSPAAVAAALPQAAGAAVLDAPVTPVVDATLGPDGTLHHASLHADVGAGTVALPVKGGGTAPLHFASLALDADGDLHAATLHALQLVLAPPSGAAPITITLAGSGTRAAAGIHAQVTLDIDHANFADLPAMWPVGTGGGSRGWLTENITTGTAHDGHFTAKLEAHADGSGLTMTEAGGTMAADNLTIWWLRPVPPVEHGRADLVLQSPDVMTITAREGRIGNIVLRDGTMRITGLSVHDQVSVIEADLAAPIADTLTLLRNPRLHLLSTHPLPITHPSGSTTVHLTVDLPLENKLTPDQVGIHAVAKLTDAHLGTIAAGKDLNDATATIDATNARLKAEGSGRLDTVPAKFTVGMDFTDGPGSQVVQHVTADLHGTGAELKASGLDFGDVLAGSLSAAADYAERRDGRATVKLDADLREAAVTTPLGWAKAVGSPGHAAVRAQLAHGRITEVDLLSAEAPGLSVEGRSEIADGKPSVLHIERGIVGRSNATGTISFPQTAADPYRVVLSGSHLDISSQAAAVRKPQVARAAATEKGPPYVLDLRFDRVLVGSPRGLGPVTLQASSDGQRITFAHVVSAGPEQLRLDLHQAGNGRSITATAGDLGALLREAKLADEITGGVMTVDAHSQDRLAGAPLSGSFDLSHFSVRNAPIVGKILQGLTLYGLGEALSGPGLVFDRLATPFQLTGSVLDVSNARAYSASLGVTARGLLNFSQGTVSLQGTVVPLYFFNSLPGRIPLLGKLFSPEQGGGLFAASYGLNGKIADPSIWFNPLSIVTPGALRNLFDVFR